MSSNKHQVKMDRVFRTLVPRAHIYTWRRHTNGKLCSCPIMRLVLTNKATALWKQMQISPLRHHARLMKSRPLLFILWSQASEQRQLWNGYIFQRWSFLTSVFVIICAITRSQFYTTAMSFAIISCTCIFGKSSASIHQIRWPGNNKYVYNFLSIVDTSIWYRCNIAL